jgi:CubicO group peptidase (beta-lactamase class C family)
MRWLWRTVLLLGCLLLAMPVFAQNSTSYTDPTGQFSVQIPDGLEVSENDGYITITSPDQALIVYLLALPSDDLNQAIVDAWGITQPDFDATDYESDMAQTIDDPAQLQGYDQALVITYELDTTKPEGKVIQAVALLYQGVSYVALYDTNLITAQQRAAQVQVINSSFQPTSKARASVADVAVATWDDDIQAQLVTFIEEALPILEVPGVAIGVVQNGELVYASGFGQADEVGNAVDADTRMLIGSTTKSMTTLLMAQTVDVGNMAWDTPVTDIMPSFAVADPAITQQFAVENLVCACTGVPRRDLELLVNSNDLTAQDLIASLQTYDFYTAFGETFQYSNQLVATGGYVATMANGVAYDDVLEGYINLMDTQVFAPLGMTRTTFDFDQVLAGDNYAQPYGASVFGYTPMTVDEERWLLPLVPAGGAWSTVNDMAQYIIMELNQGVSADDKRIVSTENLTYTWQPQVQINATDSYGFGWIISDYKGVPLISHGGNTLGFSSELLFAPEHNFGLVVLVNQQGSSLPTLIRARFLALMFGEEDVTTPTLATIAETSQETKEAVARKISPTFDRALVSDYIGTFSNDVLGDITLFYEGDTLKADFGTFVSAVYYAVNLPDEEATPNAEATADSTEPETAFLLGEPPLAGTPLQLAIKDGVPTVTIGVGTIEYVFVKQ